MKKVKLEIKHVGFDVLIKSKEGVFETVEVGIPSRALAHEFIKRNYKNSAYRIEGRRVNYTPNEYEFKKKAEVEEEAQ
jgi:hypothetical protein